MPCGFIVPFLSWMSSLQPKIVGPLLPDMGWYYEWVEPNILGEEPWGYWWPLLITLPVGCLLCYISKYQYNRDTESYGNATSPFLFLFMLIKYGVYCIVGFFALVFAVIGIYYTFFTEYIFVIVPIVTAVAVLGYLIYVGCRYYKNYKKQD